MKFNLKVSTRYLLIGLLIIVLAFSYLEYLHPCYFTQDDNFAQFLPVLTNSLNQLFTGHLPAINYHQFMGSPVYETGTYAALYPPLILSYFLSNYIFHNNFLLLEIFALFHLLFGFVCMYYLIGSRVKDSSVCVLGSVTFTLSGYVLVLSNSWYYILPSLVFIPLIFILHSRLQESSKISQIVYLGLVRSIYFYAGNAQFFFYTLLFEFCFFILTLYSSKNRARYSESYILSLVFTFAFILPLLIPQYLFSVNSPRLGRSIVSYAFSYGASIRDTFLGGILQYPLVKSSSYIGYAQQAFIEAYHWNTLFFVLFLASTLYAIYIYRASIFKKEPFLALSLLGFVLSLGAIGILYLIGGLLPIFKNFSIPWKFFIYGIFFAILFSSKYLEKIFKDPRMQKFKVKYVFFALFLIVLVTHLHTVSQVSLSYYGDHLPVSYPSNILSLSDGRIVTVVGQGELDPRTIKNKSISSKISFAPLLGQNFATLAGLYHISGYEPLVPELTYNSIPIDRFGLRDSQLNLSGLEDFGVKYIFIQNEVIPLHPELSNLSLVYSNENMSVYKLSNPKALVYTKYDLPSSIQGNSIITRSSFTDKTRVTFNVLALDGYRATLNGVNLPITRDELNRVVVTVPPGSGNIILTYHVMWFWPAVLLMLSLILVLSLYIISVRTPLMEKLSSLSVIKLKLSWINLLLTLVIIAIIVLTSFFFILISKTTITSVLRERVNLETSIKDTSFSLFTGLSIKEFKITSTDKPFSIGTLILNPNYIQSIKRTISARRPVIYLASIPIDNVSLSFDLNSSQESNCSNPLTIHYSSESEKLTISNSTIKEVIFMPINKLSANINLDALDEGNKLIPISGAVSIGNYVEGNISIGTTPSKTKQLCVPLPLAKKNNLFTQIR